MKKTLFALLAALLAVCGTARAQSSNLSYVAGERLASQYAYGYGQMAGAHIVLGNSATGTQTVVVCPAVRATGDGRIVNLFSATPPAPVSFDTGTSTAEIVTPTSVSLIQPPSGVEASQQCAAVTGSFSNTHFASQNPYQVRSGTFGLQEAINDAGSQGGSVTVDNTWGGTDTMLNAAVVWPNVSIIDKTGGAIQYWNPQAGATTLAAPATLTAVTALPSATPAGLYGTGTYFLCIAYVDLYGQEGPCSATFSEAGLATGSFIFSAPAASTGAVGYTIYISLTSGTYQLAYKVPLISQPTAIGAAAVGNGVCTLTKIETVTPACAVTNATYGQTGATATVTAITLNTSPIDPQVTTVSSTTVTTPNAGGRTTYTYVPGSHIGTPGLPVSFLPFTISAAEATTVPSVLGTINVAPQFMNFVGRTIEICGKATTTASTATIVAIKLEWDSMGQNTAGKGVIIGNLAVTPVAAFSTTKVITFCEDIQTTVAGATATGGSINTIGGFIATSGVSAAAAGQAAGSDASIGTVASLNLAADARINVVSVHTTGTDGAALTLQSLTAKVLN